MIGFSDNKQIEVELKSSIRELEATIQKLQSSTTAAPVEVNSDGDSKDKPFIVMATSVSSSFSSSVGRAARRSDVTMTKARRKGRINSARKDRINVFRKFFPMPTAEIFFIMSNHIPVAVICS